MKTVAVSAPASNTKAVILTDRCQRPKPLPVIIKNIPFELMAMRQWVIWRFNWDVSGRKWRKPPFDARTNRHAKVNDPSTWATFDDVIAAYHDGLADGIGIILSGLAGIDLDNCRDAESGQIAPSAQEIITDFDTYGDVSPTGTGVKLFLRGKLPEGRRRAGSCEIYDDGRYFTVTGHLLVGCPAVVNERQTQLDALFSQINGPYSAPVLPKIPAVIRRANLDDGGIVARAMRAKNGETFRRLWAGDTSSHDEDHSAADLGLCNILAFWSGGDSDCIDRLFRQSGLMRAKWDERRGAGTYGERTIARALEGITDFYAGGQRQQTCHGTSEKSSKSTPSREPSNITRQRLPDETKTHRLLDETNSNAPPGSPPVKYFLVSRRFKRTLPRSADEKEITERLFKLARLTKRMLPNASDDDVQTIARAWSRLATPVLGEVDWTDIAATLTHGIKHAKCPLGDIWDRLVAKAKTMPPPSGWEANGGVLVNLCHCLAEHHGIEKPFPLPVESIADSLGVSVGKASQLRKMLERAGVLVLAREYVRRVRAKEFLLGATP